MKMRFLSLQFEPIFKLVRFLLASTLLIASMPSSWALAQTTADPWDEPVNLSHSGVATNPAIVIDSESVVHAVWEDDLGKFVYTRLEDNQWREPKLTDLHRVFGASDTRWAAPQAQDLLHTGPNPLFLASPGPYIYAFWISGQGKLFTSRVRNPNFENASAWESGRLITPDVASFVATVDAFGEWHLAYFRTVEDARNPAGIYYTHSKNSGGNWSVPVLLYQSPYIRRLVTGEAHLSLATAGTADAVRVYLAWDNRPRKQVFLAQSADGGTTWEEPALVAGPAQDAESNGPFNIQVGTAEENVMLVWQSGRSTSGLLPGCSQIYQFSSDQGGTWSDTQLLAEDALGCPQSNEFLTRLPNSPEGIVYLLTESKGQVFLTAWNGLQWSQPQEQPLLSGFKEPEIYTEVTYGCRQASLLVERLYVIGCDQGGGGDIWVTSRDLESEESWFKSPTWRQLSPVTNESLQLEAIELVATDDSLIHAFLSIHENASIHYTYWNGEAWSRMAAVVKLPEGNAGWPAIAPGPENELFLVAPTSNGALYFSRATSGNATAESRWSTPARLAMIHDGEIGSADVAWDSTGTVYVTYSVPVNENRGIYLIRSSDRGASWSEPLQVFSGAAAGFDLVGGPSLLVSENDFLHIISKQQSVQGDGVPQPLALYYARSEDGGLTFSDAKLVVEEPMAWREIAVDDEGNLHLLWQRQGTNTTVWDQISSDGGSSWQVPQGLPNQGPLAAVTRDPGGELHLLGVGLQALDHWRWDAGRWKDESPVRLSLASQSDAPADLMAAAVNKDGEMVVVLASPADTGSVAESMLFYSTGTFRLPSEQAAGQKDPTPTLLPPTLAPATSAPELLSSPTAVVDVGTVTQEQINSVETSDPTAPYAVALVPVALILLSVLGLAVWRAARSKER